MKGTCLRYKDAEGNTIKTSVVDEKDQPVDKDYDSRQRPKTITTTDGKFTNWSSAGNYTVGDGSLLSHLDATTGKLSKDVKMQSLHLQTQKNNQHNLVVSTFTM